MSFQGGRQPEVELVAGLIEHVRSGTDEIGGVHMIGAFHELPTVDVLQPRHAADDRATTARRVRRGFSGTDVPKQPRALTTANAVALRVAEPSLTLCRRMLESGSGFRCC